MKRFLMILTAALTLAVTAPAAQAKGDCASTGLWSDGRAIIREAVTKLTLGRNPEKAETDVYQLLNRQQPDVFQQNLSLFTLAIAQLNCAALEGSDEYAADMRVQLAELMGERVSRLTADRVQKWLRKRLENGTPGQFHLLSEDEQAVFSNIFCHVALDLDETLTDPLKQLLADAQLPPCWVPDE